MYVNPHIFLLTTLIKFLKDTQEQNYSMIMFTKNMSRIVKMAINEKDAKKETYLFNILHQGIPAYHTIKKSKIIAIF